MLIQYTIAFTEARKKISFVQVSGVRCQEREKQREKPET